MYRKMKRKYRNLAEETNENVVIDLNYRMLNSFFNPLLEILSAVFFIAYMLLLNTDFHLAFIHIIIMWFMYLTIRSARNQIRPTMKDAYQYTFIFLCLNQLLIIYYLIREMICCSMDYGLLVVITGCVLALLLVLKIIIYFISFNSIRKELSEG